LESITELADWQYRIEHLFASNATTGPTQGGGALNHASSATNMTLTHCTIAGNSSVGSDGGGGIRVRGPEFTMQNCIVAGNTLTGTGTGADVNTTVNVALGGANIIRTKAGAGIYTGSGTNSTADPLLAPLNNYGGPTQIMALLPASPASPARNAATVLAPAITSDQRGFTIIGTPDIGAYEAGTFTNYNAWIYETLPAAATAPQHDSTFDYDNDGQTNEAEWLALTDPTSATSYFRVTQTAHSGNNFSVTFPTAVGRTYQLQSSPNLANPWANVGTATAGTGSNVILPVNVTGQPKHFFRVAVGVP
jgi:hypothetical protein